MPPASEPYDVVLVGFGPTGATLASLLGRAGHRVRVVEREREVYRLPRAVHFDHEVMRIFQAAGVAEAALPHTAPIDDYRFLNADRELLLGGKIGGPSSDQGWAVDYMFHQPSLERVLRDAAEALPNVEVAYGGELVGVESHDDGAAAIVRGPDGEERIEGRFVVGADGAASATRRSVGLELEDLGFDEPWVVVDLQGAKGLPDYCVQLCDPARPTTLVPGAHGFYRFEFMLRPGEGPEMDRPENVRRLLSDWLDPDSVEIVRAAVYRFHAVIARQWAKGRVAIAGDAAHQTPPFLGQGMCAGIRDAANLAWKLDLLLRGRAGDALLDTYGSERGPHVRSFVDTAVLLGRIICTQDPEAARVRDAQMLADGRAGRPVVPALPDTGPGCLQGGQARAVHPRVGRLAPQPFVRARGGETRLDDVSGAGFRLVLRDARGWPDAERRARLATLPGRALVWSDAPGEAPEGGLHCRDASGAAEAFFEEHGIHAFLARPDHVTFGVAKSPDDVAALLDDLEAALGR
jgi:3-(3-hydroxy-phenyl)propionate hydroxylase